MVFESIFDFIKAYWQNIMVSIIVGFIFFVLSSMVFKIRERSVAFERYKKAKGTILDILESSLINKQEPTQYRIKHIIQAAQREENVELRDSPLTLLEDLELRFEKSRHLDTNQQTYFINQIEELISQIETEDRIRLVPLSYEKILESLKSNIESGKKEDSIADLNNLTNKLSESSKSPDTDMSNITRMISVLVAVVTIVLILSDLLKTSFLPVIVSIFIGYILYRLTRML